MKRKKPSSFGCCFALTIGCFTVSVLLGVWFRHLGGGFLPVGKMLVGLPGLIVLSLLEVLLVVYLFTDRRP